MDERAWKAAVSLAVCAVLLASGVPSTHCAEAAAQAVERNTRPLGTSTPVAQGVDSVRLAAAYAEAAKLGPLFSLLVMKNGFLVGEQYFHGARQDTAYNVKSVSKSILSALVGIAIREGYMESVDEPISRFFPEHFTPFSDTLVGWSANRLLTDSLRRRVTVRHLLTHTAGFAFEENELLFWAWFWSSDYVRFYLELPLVARPGEQFIYSTAGTHALSAILARATGMDTREFADRWLFAPLGIEVHRWDRGPTGVPIGGSEMHFTARELARFGQLYLDGGVWDGRQIVPAEWVAESTREQVRANYETPHRGIVSETWTSEYYKRMNHTGYGYLWWRRDSAGHETFVALGYGGQLVFVIPDLHMVVVTTSAWDEGRNPDRWAHYLNVYRVLDEMIVAAAGG